MPKVTIKLDKETGLGTLEFNGKTYECGGKPGYDYLSDSMTNGFKYENYHSQTYDVDMPYAVCWWPQRGIYIHEWPNLEGSAGCIHLLSPDAKEFYDSINGKVRIVFQWTKD